MRVCRCSATTVCSLMFVSKLGRHKRTKQCFISPGHLSERQRFRQSRRMFELHRSSGVWTNRRCLCPYVHTGDSRSCFVVEMPTTFLFTSVTSRNGLSPQTLAYPTQCEFRQFAVLVSLPCVLTVPVPWCSYLVLIVDCVYILWVIAIWN